MNSVQSASVLQVRYMAAVFLKSFISIWQLAPLEELREEEEELLLELETQARSVQAPPFTVHVHVLQPSLLVYVWPIWYLPSHSCAPLDGTSLKHSREQPSPSWRLRSSHCSPVCRVPSPHVPSPFFRRSSSTCSRSEAITVSS
jgi:hypothetical protein